MRRKRTSVVQRVTPLSGVTASAISRNRIAQSPRWRLTYSMGLAPSGPLGPRSLVATTHASQTSGSKAEVKTIGFATQRMAVSRVIAAPPARLILLPQVHAGVEVRDFLGVAV